MPCTADTEINEILYCGLVLQILKILNILKSSLHLGRRKKSCEEKEVKKMTSQGGQEAVDDAVQEVFFLISF